MKLVITAPEEMIAPARLVMTLPSDLTMTKDEFFPLCPDFVVELQSPSDRLNDLQEKMQEYIENGAQLGWLLLPDTRSVYSYRPGQQPEYLASPTHLAGDPVLPGFVLPLAEIWEPGF
jgi:Uma2 family endonuclease